MPYPQGTASRNKLFQSATTRLTPWSIALYFLLFLASVFHAGSTQAAEAVPLSTAEAELIALADEPGFLALAESAAAVMEQSVAAGQLPDPQIVLGMQNFPIQSGGFTTEGMSQAVIGLRQAFPRGDTRKLKTRRLESLSSGLTADTRDRARQVRLATRRAWLGVYYWEHARKLVLESHAYFSDLLAITRSLYAVGSRNQQDVLRAEIELSRLDDRLIEIDRQVKDQRARLAQWIGAAHAARPLDTDLPAWSQVPNLAELTVQLDAHPAMFAADARIAASESSVALANERYKPAWGLEARLGLRGGELANGNSRSDFATVMLTFDLPLFHKNRQDRILASARHQKRSSLAARTKLARSLRQELASEYARWIELSRRIGVYRERIVPQSAELSAAALAAYQTNTADFADVMRAYIHELDTRIEHAELQTDRLRSYAAIAALGGF
ncbi:MAG: TolC family protein [Proteobacteria bacterium]|nr:TolC family protein [Pseudomonadota bacterium]